MEKLKLMPWLEFKCLVLIFKRDDSLYKALILNIYKKERYHSLIIITESQLSIFYYN